METLGVQRFCHSLRDSFFQSKFNATVMWMLVVMVLCGCRPLWKGWQDRGRSSAHRQKFARTHAQNHEIQRTLDALGSFFLIKSYINSKEVVLAAQ